MDHSILNTDDGLVAVAELCGWNEQLAKENFDLFDAKIPQLRIVGSSGPRPVRSMLWEVSRKVLGEDTENYRQEVGDCSSFGGKNAAEYVQIIPIANGDRSTFKNIFPPHIYGIERVIIGKGQLGAQDGGFGGWVADSVMQYGVISTDTPNCPSYSGTVARSWGYYGVPKEFQEIGKTHIIKSAAAVKTVDDLKNALSNGYPCIACSNVGFDMAQRSDGFMHYSTHWGHCMTLIGYDDGNTSLGIPENFCLLNSWGDVFGTIVDFRTKENWPKGTLRISAKDVQNILNAQDSYVFSTTGLFSAQDLPRSSFDL